MGKRSLSVMLAITAAMVLCLIFSDHWKAQEVEEADRDYQTEYSLFEDIVIGGGVSPGTAGTGVSLGTAGGSDLKASDTDSGSVSGAEEASLSQDTRTPEERADIPPAKQEISLFRTGEDSWEMYLPADMADKAYIYFSHFDSLTLIPGTEKTSTETGEDSPGENGAAGKAEEETTDSLTFYNGNAFPVSSLKSGSVWQAQAADQRGKVIEEAEIAIYCAGDVPTLYVNTQSGSLEAIDSDQSVREECRYLVCSADGKKDASGKCEIHGRGNSSWKEDKKQYSLNLASLRSILGMEQSRKFALIANYSDASFLRNKTAYDLAVLSDMPASVQSAFVNVYFNGAYHGLYLMAQRPNARDGSVHISNLEKRNEEEASLEPLMQQEKETAQGDSETVDVTVEEGIELHASPREAVPDNITGGYLLEIDGRYEEEDYWFSTKTHHFVVQFPEKIPLKECEYIAGYLREAEKALYSEDGVNPDTGKSWEEYFDKDSWAAMYLLQDFMGQWDVESFSFFIYKDADDPLLYCGPAWDFDLSMGTTGIGNLPNVMRQSVWLREHREGWLTELEKFPAFCDTLDTFADETFFPLLTEYMGENARLSLPGMEEQIRNLAGSAAMDVRRWNKEDKFAAESAKLIDWLQGRVRFWQGYRDNPSAYCRLTLRYGFKDMDIYSLRGEPIGFVPTEEYGEHFYSSFRKKYGSIDGWRCEDGSLLTPETVINADQVLTPFSEQDSEGEE